MSYDNDILLWSEQQATLLRRFAAGERVNSAAIDWPNVAEEIESVGRTELRACASLLRLAMLHAMKARCWPQSREVSHWRSEARSFRRDAIEAFSPSMRQRLDIAALYRRVLDELPDEIDGASPLPPPVDCPFTLDELLQEPGRD
ncbi:MAG: DUF29 domain-containing protein [Acetobacteraceae bacterium]|nr:DUF29 domain-containing protein [Acetobacteraceae bacterium]